MKKYIYKFDEISAKDINIVGGKGANLGMLKSADINVPDGFCVTTIAYREFIKPIEDEIYALAGTINTDDLTGLKKIAQTIRNLLNKNDLSIQIKKEIIDTWKALGKYDAYAVRSSATAEDLPQASFAGQQDTYLNIMGEKNLLQAVKDCFISLFTDRAILYRIQNDFNHADVALSVVVQKMIMPESAGIMFTADPISGNRNVLTIDASFGLGEALVSGLVSADLYKVDKENRKIISKDIADKKIAMIPLKEGGIKTINLDKKRMQQTLDDTLILKLSELGKKIEAHYKKPQDIEWAVEQGTLYITQSRPITSLFPIPNMEFKVEKGYEDIFLSIGHIQVMTDAMPPLSLSLFSTFLPFSMYEAGGRLYANISAIIQNTITRKIFLDASKEADHLVSLSLTQWIKEHSNFKTKSKISMGNMLKFIVPFAGSVMHRIFLKKYRNMPNEMNLYIDAYIKNFKETMHTKTTEKEKIAYMVIQAKCLFSDTVIWKPEYVAGTVATTLNEKLIQKWAKKSDIEAIKRGFVGNVNTEMNLAVGDLADLAQRSESLREYILQNDLEVNKKLQGCLAFEGGKSFIKAWKNFLTTYGARANSEIDIYRPRWHEDASSLMQIVMGILSTAKKGAHRVHYQKLIDEHNQAVINIIKDANHGVLGKLRQAVVKRLLYVMNHLVPLRDHHKFLMVQFMSIAKLQLLETAQYLHREDKLKK